MSIKHLKQICFFKETTQRIEENVKFKWKVPKTKIEWRFCYAEGQKKEEGNNAFPIFFFFLQKIFFLIFLQLP